MAEGDGVVYNGFKEWLMEGVYNLASGGDTLQMTLHNTYAPNIDTDDLWADISATEYGAGSGYTSGGETLATQDVTRDTTDDEGVFDADNVTWTSLGPLSPNPPEEAVLWDTTPTSPLDPLICYWELGTTLTNGGNYTLQFATEGIVNIT